MPTGLDECFSIHYCILSLPQINQVEQIDVVMFILHFLGYLCIYM